MFSDLFLLLGNMASPLDFSEEPKEYSSLTIMVSLDNKFGILVLIWEKMSKSRDSLIIPTDNLIFLTDINVLICDFHREQAWGRWLRGRVQYRHGLSEQSQEELKVLLRRIARSGTETELESSLISLKSNDLYTTNCVVYSYLETTWFPHMKVKTIHSTLLI